VSDDLGTTIDDLVAALKSRRAPLPFEIGAFVALSACEAVASAPVAVKGKDVRIALDGSVSVPGAQKGASDEASARSIVALLAQLLVAAGPSVPPRLLMLIERGPSDGKWRVEGVRDELAAALVPLNRGASRRVLARLVRESEREHRPSAADEASGASSGALDEDLDALFEGAAVADAAAEAREGDAFDTLPGGPAPEMESGAGEGAGTGTGTGSGTGTESEAEAEVALEAVAAPVRRAPRVVVDRLSLEGLDGRPARRSGLGRVVVQVVVLVVAAVVALYFLRPDLLGLAPPPGAPSGPSAPSAPSP
jgi:hypothetical protein